VVGIVLGLAVLLSYSLYAVRHRKAPDIYVTFEGDGIFPDDNINNINNNNNDTISKEDNISHGLEMMMSHQYSSKNNKQQQYDVRQNVDLSKNKSTHEWDDENEDEEDDNVYNM
jgi:hypothetical protein